MNYAQAAQPIMPRTAKNGANTGGSIITLTERKKQSNAMKIT